ncbi:molybdopterin synthase sulfur carrier subunit [Vulcanisaeta sp. EB80]|uniref:MoaD/ThiS family protein n=1 Tax=Vulcanisaeta sp. EB80 TaxID=1650660 RepID=UPI00074928CF|nr:MoaD/ThiS family protein [Vulcanisaeta sp. EB80]KUO80549.1 MAG: molybdopterin synthase sulfur carrier subunit [Vulcanisaeta sp. JCHS_4]KUO94437.1 MAG: molybdopterin synthase sulfur carrier subunit [Vulcanisaeta sp. CIS_19]PLC67956.1 molybdopterin synthase sulfur carrier subunit [Vulcanisaeta sp. EB80]PLC67984.1 molybdopterin synthase sulfur carrier subunit [Vulcanisaeta sp. EB80]
MKVQVKFLASLYDVTKVLKTEIELPDNATVMDLIKTIDKAVSPNFSSVILDDGKLKDQYVVLINGRSIDFLSGLGTRLSNGDEVTFLPPAGGG